MWPMATRKRPLLMRARVSAADVRAKGDDDLSRCDDDDDERTVCSLHLPSFLVLLRFCFSIICISPRSLSPTFTPGCTTKGEGLS